ncbi:hypothetical protein [Pseudomonas putida]|uniref:hypothetical protein n=1 Tax=Pseudomonas putida TaxID=303 RepID=UPI001E369394|nr:hypothetical protein [Pseudomonas putida]MCE0958735.1 hypothetical protein [Pseudomonas putida]
MLDSNLNLYEAILPHANYSYHNNKAAIKPAQAMRVLGLCFMSTVGAWEEFVGRSFVRYMAGASTPTYTPILKIGSCKSIDHAIDVLAGEHNFDLTKKYFTWTKYVEVRSRANVFFERGEPYTKIPQIFEQRLSDAVMIRNRVAHSSDKCVKDFAIVARRLMGIANSGKLPQGTSVGKLLRLATVNHFQAFNGAKTYYHAFDQMFRHLAFMLVPE